MTPAALLDRCNAGRVAIAQRGVIEGGKHAGWAYRFESFGLASDGSLTVAMLCTPTGWPFPKRLQLRMTEFTALTPVKGEKFVPRLLVKPLLLALLGRNDEIMADKARK